MKWWGIFISMTLKICLFFPQHSLRSQGGSFIVSRHLPCQTESHVPVSSFILPGMWCLWKAPAQLLGMSRFHPPPRWDVAGKFFPWCMNVMAPGSFAPEAALWRGAQFPVLFSPQLSHHQQTKKLCKLGKLSARELFETHWTSLCSSRQGTVF